MIKYKNRKNVKQYLKQFNETSNSKINISSNGIKCVKKNISPSK